MFWLPVLYVFIVGLFFSEEAKGTRLLHRDQTDEWKGEIVRPSTVDDDQALSFFMKAGEEISLL